MKYFKIVQLSFFFFFLIILYNFYEQLGPSLFQSEKLNAGLSFIKRDSHSFSEMMRVSLSPLSTLINPWSADIQSFWCRSFFIYLSTFISGLLLLSNIYSGKSFSKNAYIMGAIALNPVFFLAISDEQGLGPLLGLLFVLIYLSLFIKKVSVKVLIPFSFIPGFCSVVWILFPLFMYKLNNYKKNKILTFLFVGVALQVFHYAFIERIGSTYSSGYQIFSEAFLINENVSISSNLYSLLVGMGKILLPFKVSGPFTNRKWIDLLFSFSVFLFLIWTFFRSTKDKKELKLIISFLAIQLLWTLCARSLFSLDKIRSLYQGSFAFYEGLNYFDLYPIYLITIFLFFNILNKKVHYLHILLVFLVNFTFLSKEIRLLNLSNRSQANYYIRMDPSSLMYNMAYLVLYKEQSSSNVLKYFEEEATLKVRVASRFFLDQEELSYNQISQSKNLSLHPLLSLEYLVRRGEWDLLPATLDQLVKLENYNESQIEEMKISLNRKKQRVLFNSFYYLARNFDFESTEQDKEKSLGVLEYLILAKTYAQNEEDHKLVKEEIKKYVQNKKEIEKEK